MRASTLLRSISVSFGLLLVVAAWMKGWELLSFAPSPDFPPLWLGWSEVLAEWALGTWLVSGVAPERARKTSLAVLGIFIGVSSVKLLRGADTCGCFGSLKVHPAWTLSANLLLFTGIFVLGARERRPAQAFVRSLGHRLAFSVSWSVFLGLALAAAAILRPTAVEFVYADPKTWEGTNCPLLQYLDETADLSELVEGKSLIILYDPGCSKCISYVTSLGQRSEGQQATWILDISGGPPEHNGEVPFPILQLRDNTRIVTTVPWQVFLSKGVVSEVEKPL